MLGENAILKVRRGKTDNHLTAPGADSYCWNVEPGWTDGQEGRAGELQ